VVVTRHLPPHPVLRNHYATPQDRAAFVQSLFDETSSQYDWANAVFFFGTGARYRRRALIAAGLKPGMRVLDVAVGTGTVAEAAQHILGNGAVIVGLDISSGMLQTARRRLNISLIQASAESLPLADTCIDFIVMGYALRHVSDLGVVFREFHRVLRPGGRLLMLEIGRPPNALYFAAAKFYFKHLLPTLSRVISPRTKLATLMDYYWDTIESCVPSSTIITQMAETGFAEPICTTELGLFQAYRALR
jgi:demethylmenaquinone methyltransferase / 2-methoxy-6-polyprenyl-1,4-benzoquinol methylase